MSYHRFPYAQQRPFYGAPNAHDAPVTVRGEIAGIARDVLDAARGPIVDTIMGAAGVAASWAAVRVARIWRGEGKTADRVHEDGNDAGRQVGFPGQPGLEAPMMQQGFSQDSEYSQRGEADVTAGIYEDEFAGLAIDRIEQLRRMARGATANASLEGLRRRLEQAIDRTQEALRVHRAWPIARAELEDIRKVVMREVPQGWREGMVALVDGARDLVGAQASAARRRLLEGSGGPGMRMGRLSVQRYDGGGHVGPWDGM